MEVVTGERTNVRSVCRGITKWPLLGRGCCREFKVVVSGHLTVIVYVLRKNFRRSETATTVANPAINQKFAIIIESTSSAHLSMIHSVI